MKAKKIKLLSILTLTGFLSLYGINYNENNKNLSIELLECYAAIDDVVTPDMQETIDGVKYPNDGSVVTNEWKSGDTTIQLYHNIYIGNNNWNIANYFLMYKDKDSFTLDENVRNRLGWYMRDPIAKNFYIEEGYKDIINLLGNSDNADCRDFITNLYLPSTIENFKWDNKQTVATGYKQCKVFQYEKMGTKVNYRPTETKIYLTKGTEGIDYQINPTTNECYIWLNEDDSQSDIIAG